MNWRFGVLILSLLIGVSGCSSPQSMPTPMRRFAVVAPRTHKIGKLIQDGNHRWLLSWDDHTWQQVHAETSDDGWHAQAYDRFHRLIAR